MTVKQLIEALQECNPNAIVVKMGEYESWHDELTVSTPQP